MFNTGDIVSWRDDGKLNTYGRADDQVKIKVSRAVLYSVYIADCTRDFGLSWTV
jgi:uncharacterized protein YijF (DUF1287 family)